MALVAHFDLELHQMDVKTAFLNGDIDEMIYMMQPENFVSNESKSMVCKLKKSIYGLKQAYCITSSIKSLPQTFSRQIGSKYIFLVLYVDDILLASSDTDLLHETKRFMMNNFEMKDLGEASFVLGIQMLRDRSQGILRLSQENYINKVLKRFGMKDSKPRDTPIVKGDKFSLKQCPNDDLERNEMQKNPYASVVGSLMYAQVCTRPNIAFMVGVLGRYLSDLECNIGRQSNISSCTLTSILLDVKITNTPCLDTSTCWLEELSLRKIKLMVVWLRKIINQRFSIIEDTEDSTTVSLYDKWIQVPSRGLGSEWTTWMYGGSRVRKNEVK
ncbi:hypothetical protein CR513_33349, partial [Mucuna pruriens]